MIEHSLLPYEVASIIHVIYVALCRTPGMLGVPGPWCSYSTDIFRQFWLGTLQTWHVQSMSSYLPMLHH